MTFRERVKFGEKAAGAIEDIQNTCATLENLWELYFSVRDEGFRQGKLEWSLAGDTLMMAVRMIHNALHELSTLTAQIDMDEFRAPQEISVARAVNILACRAEYLAERKLRGSERDAMMTRWRLAVRMQDAEAQIELENIISDLGGWQT